MIFNDYVEILNEQVNEIKKLDDMISEFDRVLYEGEKLCRMAFEQSYTNKLNYTTGAGQSSINDFNSCIRTYIKGIRETLIAIDFFELKETLSNFKEIGGECFEEESELLVKEFYNTYEIIRKYMKLNIEYSKENTFSAYTECISAIRSINNTIINFKNMVYFMNKINKKLNKNIDEQGLEIRLLNECIEKESYNNVVDPAYEIYNKLCEIANISSDIDKLEIVRVETGSLFVKFIGNKSIIKLMAKLIESAHTIFIRNYTREGQKQNLVESTELFKQQFDILAEMKEMGLDVAEHEEIAKETLVLLMKQSNILLSSSPDVRINNKVLSKSEDMKKLLETKVYKMLSEKNEEKEKEKEEEEEEEEVS